MEQHDNHCWVTFLGSNWMIARVDQECMVMALTSDDGKIGMDFSRMDWPAYCRTAREWIDEAS